MTNPTEEIKQDLFQDGFRVGMIEGKLKKEKDILTARRCMNYQLIKCKNKDCLNLRCPLNKKYDRT